MTPVAPSSAPRYLHPTGPILTWGTQVETSPQKFPRGLWWSGTQVGVRVWH